LIHAAVPNADFSINNLGGLRTVWLPGIIQYQHFYNMLPFVNYLVSFDMTGNELLQTLAAIQGGTYGFYPSYGIKQTVKIDTKGKKHFVNATWMNGQPIITSI
jgi:2',3'-cyclic-nucleotide 2'-phosphodiesterase (5'-nucleotidase family)